MMNQESVWIIYVEMIVMDEMGPIFLHSFHLTLILGAYIGVNGEKVLVFIILAHKHVIYNR